jgi:hypothetical protein
VGQDLLGPSYFFIPLVLGPLNLGEYPEGGYMAVGSFLFLKEQIKGIIISLVWYVPSLRYTRGLGWRMH